MPYKGYSVHCSVCCVFGFLLISEKVKLKDGFSKVSYCEGDTCANVYWLRDDQ